uniref:Uncharacterized protein n=1 Tax=Marmota marmota marmota TaxID=9994 RepID=A0A8C5YX51_MARMA
MKWWVLETLLFYSTSLLSTSLLRLRKKKKRPNNKDQKTSELRDASYLASSHWLPFHEIRKTSILFQALVLGNLRGKLVTVPTLIHLTQDCSPCSFTKVVF